MSKNNKDLYADSGVDTTKGDALVDWLQAKGANKGIGGFAGLFSFDFKKYKNPKLVACTDGVGTKVLIATENNNLAGIGHDLVAMCVNDMYTVGAKPLFFLDYYATGKLNESQFKSVLSSIKEALKICDCELLGGETAEMPGLYQPGHLDLAGFMVGVVDTDKTLGSHRVSVSDLIFAFDSSGFHSNGYSLIRKLIKDNNLVADKKLIERLLTPTTIYSYLQPAFASADKIGLNALANITGGGLSGNIPRILPNNTVAKLNFSDIQIPSWMNDFFIKCNLEPQSLENVFNLGVGMVAVVAKDKKQDFLNYFSMQKPKLIGEVISSDKNEPEVEYV